LSIAKLYITRAIATVPLPADRCGTTTYKCVPLTMTLHVK